MSLWYTDVYLLAFIVKPVAQRHISLITFGVAQIAMDIEPLVRMRLNAAIFHGPSHTFLGALLIAIPVALISPCICHPLLRRFNREVIACKLGWLAEPSQPTRRCVWGSALFSTLSHVLLDSLMRHDIQPLSPFSIANPFAGYFSHDGIYQLCLVLGIVGMLGWLVVKRLQR